MRVKQSVGGQSLLNSSMMDKRRTMQFKKDYRRFFVEQMVKEYWRAYEALVGSSDADMDKVIQSFNISQFYREAREFIVYRCKFMSEDHLIHLKEDPKTILSLYRIFMLHHKTNQMSVIDKKLVVRKAAAKKNDQAQTATGSGLNFNDAEESDYSDSDF